jgi:hypothetical protein
MVDGQRQGYGAVYDSFDVAGLDRAFQGSSSDGINACVERCDRYAGSGRTALN